MAEHSIPQRRGTAVNLTLDAEAVALLQELAPSKKHKGSFVSGLLLAERARRLEQQRLREAIARVFEESAP